MKAGILVDQTPVGLGVWIQICRGAMWHYQRSKYKTRCGLDAAVVTPHNFSKARPADLSHVCSKCREWQLGDAALLRDHLTWTNPQEAKR